MKKKFLLCFFLTNFLWGEAIAIAIEIVKIVESAERPELLVSQKSEESKSAESAALLVSKEIKTGEKSFFQKHWKTMLGLGVGLLCGGSATTIATLYATGVTGGSSGLITKSSSSDLISTTSGSFQGEKSGNVVTDFGYLPDSVENMNPGPDYASMMIDPSNQYIFDHCPNGEGETKNMDFPAGAKPRSFFSDCRDLWVRKENGLYTKCKNFVSDAFKREVPYACPSGHQYGQFLVGPNNRFKGTGYAGSQEEMGTDKFVKDARISPDRTRGVFRDQNGNFVVMGEFYGRLRYFVECATNSLSTLLQCPPGKTEGPPNKVDDSGEQSVKKHSDKKQGMALTIDNFLRHCLFPAQFQQTDITQLNLKFTEYFDYSLSNSIHQFFCNPGESLTLIKNGICHFGQYLYGICWNNRLYQCLSNSSNKGYNRNQGFGQISGNSDECTYITYDNIKFICASTFSVNKDGFLYCDGRIIKSLIEVEGAVLEVQGKHYKYSDGILHEIN